MEEAAAAWESDCGVTAGDNCSPSLSTAASLCTWPILFLPLSHKTKNMKFSYSGGRLLHLNFQEISWRRTRKFKFPHTPLNNWKSHWAIMFSCPTKYYFFCFFSFFPLNIIYFKLLGRRSEGDLILFFFFFG